MLSKLLKAGLTASTATVVVIIGKAYHQTIQSEAIEDAGDFGLEATKEAARELVWRRKEECGAPGVTIAVSKNGRLVWAEGFGFADVENLSAMTPRHVLRIASISKPVTAALAGRAVDAGRLDVRKTVHHYLPHYPRQEVDGETVDMTVDQVLMHRSGIRHYHKKPEALKIKEKEEKNFRLAHEILSEQVDNGSSISESSNVNYGESVKEKTDKNLANANEKQRQSDKNHDESKSDLTDSKVSKKVKQELAKIVPASEMHTAIKYKNVGESLNVFKNDDLIHKPGSDFHYSTHGYTLLSAVLEAATGTRFSDLLRDMFHTMDLRATHLDENDTIIRNRAKYYVRDKGGRLRNAPHVDNSWKIAGGGLLSTPSDLCRFADTMLYSWQADSASNPPGYLRPETARWLWTPPDAPPAGRRHWSAYRYARGWQVRERRPEVGTGPGAAMVACHTGGAAGCSSILLVRPEGRRCGDDGRPRGVSVAVIVNTEGADLRGLADDVARLFAD